MNSARPEPLPYLLITVKVSELEKVSVRYMRNLTTVNTLTAADKYFHVSKGNLTQPIQIYLSKSQKTVFEYFSAFSKSGLNFEHFKRKGDPLT